ncbi:hypothetical protein RI444_20040 [Paenarthrobacter sp. AT5]|uniref:hypothetical protein n=1 Tax=Paenarthrobacter TaxID=1742992 RepID=UPI001A98DB35|nr:MULTISPECIES: hypothetical protein [Paenarthrobacter]WOC60759.1 hypothetical protein RI444_20040 [Paenarthrobacter sp. AT5]
MAVPLSPPAAFGGTLSHIPNGTLTSRISGLDQEGIQLLLDYERAHGNRLPVIQILESRLNALKGGTEPSGTTAPEVSQSSTGSPVSPATSGPPVNPPSQGDPTNPAQPR